MGKLASCVISPLVVSWLDRILHCHPRKRPVFVRAGGRARGGNHRKKRSGVFTPPYSRRDDIPSMAGIYVFARVCILPLSPTHGEKSQPTFYFRHSFTLAQSLPLDCCSFSPFLFFFISSATYGLRPLFVCRRPLLGLCLSLYLYIAASETQRERLHI